VPRELDARRASAENGPATLPKSIFLVKERFVRASMMATLWSDVTFSAGAGLDFLEDESVSEDRLRLLSTVCQGSAYPTKIGLHYSQV